LNHLHNENTHLCTELLNPSGEAAFMLKQSAFILTESWLIHSETTKGYKEMTHISIQGSFILNERMNIASDG